MKTRVLCGLMLSNIYVAQKYSVQRRERSTIAWEGVKEMNLLCALAKQTSSWPGITRKDTYAFVPYGGLWQLWHRTLHS